VKQRCQSGGEHATMRKYLISVIGAFILWGNMGDLPNTPYRVLGVFDTARSCNMMLRRGVTILAPNIEGIFCLPNGMSPRVQHHEWPAMGSTKKLKLERR